MSSKFIWNDNQIELTGTKDKEIKKKKVLKDLTNKAALLGINSILKAALPVGTKRQRKGGTYQKQPNGKWVKVPDSKKEKEPKEEKVKLFKLPQDKTKMTPQQNREVVDHFKKNYSEKQLDKRISLIAAQIKRREQELESQGIDFRRKPDQGLNNLFHDRKLTETAIEEIRNKRIK